MKKVIIYISVIISFGYILLLIFASMPKHPPEIVVSKTLYRLGTYSRAVSLMINDNSSVPLQHFIKTIQAERIFEDDLPVIYLLGYKGVNAVKTSLNSPEQLKFYAIFFNKKANCLQVLEETDDGEAMVIPSLPEGRSYHQL